VNRRRVSLICLRRAGAFVLAAAFLVASSGFARSETAAKAPFPDHWNDATKGPEPEMQVQRYDADTFIIRQSIKTNFEGPFVFLFFGTDRAMLIDTGAGGLQIRPTIDKVIAQWLMEKGRKSIPLIVAHTHAHGDHIAGDHEFEGSPDVTVVGHEPEQVAAFFKIASWPEEIAPFDLGGRVLDIIPSPGHEKAELTFFDRRTHLLLTGDWLYPGRLYFKGDAFDAYRRSVDRVVKFTRPLKVSWILGNHIEMTRKPGRDFPMHAASHPDEHPLELPYARLIELQTAVHRMGDMPSLDIHPDFIIYPLP
jgi:glyoxylase-like metal-dependent hydrolase (beta-lactamase superfamily II)